MSSFKSLRPLRTLTKPAQPRTINRKTEPARNRLTILPVTNHQRTATINSRTHQPPQRPPQRITTQLRNHRVQKKRMLQIRTIPTDSRSGQRIVRMSKVPNRMCRIPGLQIGGMYFNAFRHQGTLEQTELCDRIRCSLADSGSRPGLQYPSARWRS